MLNDIVHEDYLVALLLGLGDGHCQEVRRYEVALLVVLREVFSGQFYAVRVDVYAGHLAAYLCERQQVATLAAANLQHPCAGLYRSDALHVVNIELP